MIPSAHHLIDRPLVAVDGFHHQLEHRIDDLSRLLGISVREQLHRALQVREEHRDLLALAFEGSLEVRIFSARCLGVYVSGPDERAPTVKVATACPHWRQKRAVPGNSAPQDPQASARRQPQPRQNLAWVGLSCWHRGHFMPDP